MAGKISVGSVSVSIVPSAEGFKEKVAVIVDEASAKNVHIKVEADTAEATAKMDAFRASAAGAGGSGGVGLLAGSIAAALPLLPTLIAGLVAASGAIAAAGAGLASFGAVALTDITGATKATQELQAAQTAVNNATSNTARTDALIKQQALITSLGPATIQLGTALTALDNTWKSFAAGFTPQITQAVGQFTKLMTDAFPLIQPVIQAGSSAVTAILSQLDTALKSPAAKQFFDWLAGKAGADLLGLATAFGQFGAGILQLFQAFSPLSTLVVDGLGRMAASFQQWAANLSQTKGLQDFLRYVAENGPLLTKTLGDIVAAFGRIVAALAPLLPGLLQIVDFVAKLISSVPTLDLTITALALGGLFLLNKAVVFLTDQSLVKLIPSLYAAASGEAAMGGAATVAAGQVDALGASSLAAYGKIGSLLGVLGSLGGAVAVAGAAIVGTGVLIGTAISEGRPTGTSRAYLDYVHGKITRAQYDAIANANPSGTFNAEPGYGSSATTPGLFTGSEGGAFAVTHANAEPGYGTNGLSTPAYDTSGSGTGNPPAYSLPNSSAGAGANAAANNAAGIAGLLGLNLMASLAQGITTGTNPLTVAFSNINQKLTGPAQSLGTALQNIFTSALQYGQQAAASLAFSVNGPNTVGTQTLVTAGPGGQLVTTQQSQLVGNAINTLLTDQRFVANIAKAKALGLSPALLGQFVQQGPSGAATLEALVNSGPDAIATLNQTNAAIGALGNTYGFQTAADKYGAQQTSLLTQIRDLIQAAPAATGAHVGAAVGGVAKAAVVQKATTPSRGLYSGGNGF